MIKLFMMILSLHWLLSTNSYQSDTLLSRSRPKESRFLLRSIFRKRFPPNTSIKDSARKKSIDGPSNPLSVDEIVKKVADDANCVVKAISFNRDKYNIIIAKGIRKEGNTELVEDTWNSPTSDEITDIHQKIYRTIEETPLLEPILVSTQFLISSPGIPDKLTNERDFISFKVRDGLLDLLCNDSLQGFPVAVRLTELFRKKKEYQGTLLGRDVNYVSLSLKGRKIDIPRNIIEEVFLPAAGFEEGEDPDIL